MSLRVTHNIAAINAGRHVNRNVLRTSRQLEILSSGLRVNRASDDASGLVVSEGMRSEVAGLTQNVRNAEQAFNLLQVAEGSMQEVNNILVRMRELAIQSSTSTINDRNRESVAAEFSQLTSEIDRIAQATTYNSSTLLTGFGNQVGTASTAVTTSNATGVTNVAISAAESGTYTFVDSGGDSKITLGNGSVTQTLNAGTLLDGSVVASGTSVVANFDRLGILVTLAGAEATGATGSYVDGDLDATSLIVESSTGGVFQVGPSNSFINRIEVGISDVRASGATLNLDEVNISTITSARQAIAGIDQAINTVTSERSKLGAVQNRLSFTIGYTEGEIESIQASEATIRDADMAAEVTEFSRSQILLQASTSMLVQANVGSVQALALL